MSVYNHIIRVGFSRPKKCGISSFLIRKWIGEEYSHVFIRFNLGIGDQKSDVVFHAAHGMVHFKSFKNFKDENVVVKEYLVAVSDEELSAISDHCIDLAGDKYGYVELIKIALSDMSYSLFKRQITFKNSRGYICSELVGEVLSSLGMKFDKPLNLLSPKNIEDALIQDGYTADGHFADQ